MQKVAVVLCLMLHSLAVCADYGPWIFLGELNYHRNSIAHVMLSLSEQDLPTHNTILCDRLKSDARGNTDVCIAFAKYASSMLDWQDTQMLKQKFESMKNRFSSSQGPAKKDYVQAVQKNLVARLMAFKSFKPYLDTFKEAQEREFKILSSSQQVSDTEKWQKVEKKAIDCYCTQITDGLSQVQSILQRRLEDVDDECCQNYSWESHYARVAQILFRLYAVDTVHFKEMVFKRIQADALSCVNEIKKYVQYMHQRISLQDTEKIIQCLDEERALLESPSDEYADQHASRLESLFNIQMEVEDINPYFKALAVYKQERPVDEQQKVEERLNNVKQEMMHIYFNQVSAGLREAQDILKNSLLHQQKCRIS